MLSSTIFLLLIVLAIKSISSQTTCSNKYASQNVRAAGDWSEAPIWNALEPKGLMKFDPNTCAHTVSIGGLRPNTNYNWKVAVGNSWTVNFGCVNNGDCSFTSSPNGQIHFMFSDANNQLTTDYNISFIDYTVNLPCTNPFSTKVVRAVGDFNKWLVLDDSVIMTLNSSICAYVLDLKGLTPNTDYQWKIQIGQSWAESYGCLNGGNCHAITNSTGEILLKFSPETYKPSYEVPISVTNNPTTSSSSTSSSSSSAASSSSSSSTTTTKSTTTSVSSVNPIKECYVCECPTCTNSFSSKLIRATGDWTVDAGSSNLWLANEPRGLMTYNELVCMYELILTGLKPYYNYNWKATINNSFQENYGCDGSDGPNCNFYTSKFGSVRLVFNPNTNPPQLTTDYNIAECGDGNCEANESCSYCPYDCGYCPQSVCGNGVCEESETFLACPKDCPDELPGCEVFNDQGCRLNSQIAANSGIDKRRWQTPKPGQPGYLPGFQDNYALVGYADIRYTSINRTSADLCIVAIHKNNANLTYYFNGQAQSNYCKRFTNAQNTSVSLRVIGEDGTKLDISDVNFVWNAQPLVSRPGDYRSGQKGAVAEMFGWPHKDIEKECQLIAKAGYLGVKIFPVNEQLMSNEPFSGAMNPWYLMYQPVSYKLEGRAGSREDLISLINTCRSYGVRVYIDAVLNHMTGAGNDLYDHRDPSSSCAKWANKTTSAPEDRRSPFFTHSFGYRLNPNTGQPPSEEFPGAAFGPDDFHCERSLNVWNDLFLLNNGWLVGLTDINNGKDNVRERQAAYMVELLSLGVSGFRIDAAKHIAPQDLSAIFKKVQQKMGGQFPDDFFLWLEVLTGGESGLMWTGPSWYGSSFSSTLLQDLGSQSEVDKVKIWDGLYPSNPGANPMPRNRVVIQNDDHDSQTPGSSSRDLGSLGCILVRNCSVNTHRNYEITLFSNPYGVTNNDYDWPIRFVLSSYYFTYGVNGIPDGMSSCSKCTVNCDKCTEDVPYMSAYVPGECAYAGIGYTKVHRDIKIINAMRGWMKLPPINGSDIGLPNCS